MILKSRLFVCSLALFLVGCGSINQFISRIPAGKGYEPSNSRIEELVNKHPRVNLDLYKFDPLPAQQLVYQSRLAEINNWKYEVSPDRSLPDG